MIKKTILVLGFACGLLGLAQAAPGVHAVIDVQKDILRHQAKSADSIIVVFKEDQLKKQKKSASKLSFKGISSLEKTKWGKAAEKKSKSKQKLRNDPLSKRMRNMHVGRLEKGADIADVIEELKKSPFVEYAEPNYLVQACAVPNDPLYSTMFPMNNVGQPTYEIVSGPALEWTTGRVDADMDWQEAWTNTTPGQIFPTNEVIVAVIDTGVDYTHLDITNQMWRNPGEIPGDEVDNDGNGIIDDVFGADFFYDDGDPIDLESEGGSHGTHVAGTIAAEVNNNYGVAGVNPHAKIMALKFLGPEGGYTADAIDCILYAVDQGADVLNNSWGGGSWQQSLQDAIDYAVSNGVVVLAASGNSNSGSPFYPATYRGVISVNSMDWNDERAYYSNYGWFTDVSAHGSEVVSLKCATYVDDGKVVSNATDFVVFHGTSMACPQAAGAISLLMAKHPGQHPYIYERVLEETCDTEMLSYAANKNYELGAGRINVNRMLNEDVDTGFLRIQWAEDTSLAIPGESYRIALELGTWTNDYTDVSIVATNTTAGISLGNWSYALGALPGLTTTNLSTNVFVATIDINSTNQRESLMFELRADGKVLAEQELRISFINGNAMHLVVDDFNNDGTNEIATAYGEYTMAYNNQSQLLWIAESTLGKGNNGFNISSADLNGNGYKEIVVAEHRWLLSYGEPGLFVFDFEGDLLDGFPLFMTNDYDNWNHGFGEPVLTDVDEDGNCEIVCNVRYTNGTSAIRVYESDASVKWETVFPLEHLGTPSAGDMDGDGFEEIVVWNFYASSDSLPHSQMIVLDGDGSIQSQFDLPFGHSFESKELHSYDKAVPALGDLDGDGDLEIIFYSPADEERLFAYHHDGTPVDGWPVVLPDQYGSKYTEVKLFDADLDGDVEVSTLYDIFDDGEILVQHLLLDGDGTAFGNFPTAWSDQWGKGWWMDDVTGDGQPNMMLSIARMAPGDSGLYLLDMNAETVPGWNPYPLYADGYFGTTYSLITDMGFNANRHIVMALGTKITILDTGNPLNDLDLAWPTRHHDARRTGACVVNTGTQYKCSFQGDSLYGISNLTVNFTAHTMGFDATNVWYSWDYDNNGSPDYEVFGQTLATNSYSTIGNYDVALTVSNAAGESFTRTRSNYVHVLAPVAADFTSIIQTGSVPARIRFFDLSANTPQSWQWDLDGDGSIDSTDQNPEFDYTIAGSYDVTLTVANDFGEKGGSSNSVTKLNHIVLGATADTSVKYISTNGLHVYPFKNWNEAATNIQEAVDAAGSDETVLFGDGEFLTGDGTDIRIWIDNKGQHRNGLTVKSLNGPEKTTIKGWGFEPFHGGFWIESSDDVVIDGFTISNMYNSGGGGVMSSVFTHTPTIQNCIFVNNEERVPINGGSCINIWNEGALIRDCTFINNLGRQGAIKIRTSGSYTAIVENCEFRGNSGDAYMTAAAIMIDNRSADWLFPGAPGEHIIRNCQFVENTGWYSVVYSQPSLTMDNCTFADNSVLAAGGGVLRSAHEPWSELEGANQGAWTVRNTLLANNWAESEFADQAASPINFSYSCLTTTVSGTGNVTTNDPGLSGIPGDVHLAHGSPCIDAGQNLDWMSSATDALDGDARILNTTVDIGADEYSIGCRVDATPQAGTSTLHVVFSGAASSVSGSITNYSWSFGDGSPVEQGASMTAASHSYTAEGEYLAVLRVQDENGNIASNGVVITVDDTGPDLSTATAPFETTVIVTYNEDVLESTATNLANYAIDTVVVSNAVLTGSDQVTLTVAPLADLSTNILTVSGIRDIYGNEMIGVQTQQFVYIDAYADNRMLIDFGRELTADAGWNHVIHEDKDNSGSQITNMVNARGGDTTVDFELLNDFDLTFTTHGAPSETNILYPSTAQQDVLNGTGTMRLSDMNPSNTYDLIFFASIGDNNDYSAYYGVGLQLTEVLQAYQNESNTVSLLEIEPDESGQMDIKLYKEGAGANIGVLEIRPRLPRIEISTNRVDVPEGQTASFNVRLLDDPGKETTITVSRLSGDTNISVSVGEELSFDSGNWEVWQGVQLLAAEDDDSETGSAIIRCYNDSYISRTVTAVEVENDVAVVASDSTVFVPENSGARFDVTLTAVPLSPVTVTVSRVLGDTDISVFQGTNFVFTSNDWNRGQTVVLTAQTDGDALNGTATIRLSAPSIESTTDVTAVELDSAHSGFAAYHDMDDDVSRNTNDHANVSHGRTHGTTYALKDIASGTAAGAGIVFRYYDDNGEKSAALSESTPPVPNAAAYQDAHKVFHGIIDAERVYEIRESHDNEYGIITFTNLTPGANYDVALYMNRDNLGSQDSVFTLMNAGSFMPAASAGVNDAGDSDDSTFMHGADNTEDGFVVGWDDIAPASGANHFSVQTDIYFADTRGYLPQAIRLTERDGSASHSQRVVVSTNRVLLPEPSYQTFQAQLATQPANDVTVTVAKVSGGDENIVVSDGETLVYGVTNWDISQTVTLWGGSDADDVDGEALIHCIVGSTTTLVTAVEVDDEDASGPVLRYAVAPAATILSVTFDEEVDLTTAQTAGNYALNMGVSVSSAVRDASDHRIVTLTVSTMTPGVYRLTVNDVQDLTGNAILTDSAVNVGYSGLVGFYTNTLDTDPQWDAQHLWEFGVPTGQGGTNDTPYGRGEFDPTSGYTGDNVYGYNLDGNYEHVFHDDDRFEVPIYLTSTALDCSDYVDVQLSFQRWLNVTGRGTLEYANAFIDASTDGTTWVNIYDSNEAEIFDAAWTNVSFDISSVADRSETLYLRWGMDYYWANWQASGWNIDDVLLSGVHVGEPSEGIEVSTTALTVPEGGTNQFTIRLYSEPENATTVTVARIGGDTDIQIQGASSFVFDTDDWNSWQTVTLQAAEDSDWFDGITTVRCSAVGFENVTITAVEVDNEENPVYTIPWTETFEERTLGDLAGQHGWTGDGTVQTGTVYEGTQALALTNGTASHTFLGEATNIWVTFWAQPTLSEAPPEDIPTNASAVFYVNASTNLVAYDSTNATVISSATFSNSWNKIAVSCDFISKVWNLELNSELVVSNFDFYGSPASFQALEIVESTTNAFFVDSITVSDTSDGSDPSDTDADGLPDSWETNWFGNLEINPGDMASNGVDTVWATYIAGLDPTSPTNRFLVSVLRSPSSVLRWNSVSGRVYSVWWTSNLLSSFQPLETNLPWTEMPYTDTNNPSEDTGFYQIEVELE